MKSFKEFKEGFDPDKFKTAMDKTSIKVDMTGGKVAKEAKQKELKTYAKALKKIGKGHQELVDNLDGINKDELKEQLTQHANDIRDIISEFNKIAK